MTLLIELSKHARWGLKGRGATAWLQTQGIEVPARPNRVSVQTNGMVVARYAENEFAFATFQDESTACVDHLRNSLEKERPEGCYGVPRADSQAAFGLSDSRAVSALSRVCPADLRPHAFREGDVLQTLCAGVSAQLWNLPGGQVVVLCDSSVAHHQRTALQAAIENTPRRTT